jgi:prevent-host-death family protein
VEVNIHQAKTQLSRLIEKVLAGEDVVIAKAGNPLVRLVRIDHGKPVLGLHPASSSAFLYAIGDLKQLTPKLRRQLQDSQVKRLVSVVSL